MFEFRKDKFDKLTSLKLTGLKLKLEVEVDKFEKIILERGSVFFAIKGSLIYI